MNENYTEYHHKVKNRYLELFKDKLISNKKNDLRQILEAILNRLLIKHCGATLKQLENDEYGTIKNKFDKLISANRIHGKYRSALLFLKFEGNMGSHTNVRTDDAGEESYIEALIICIKPIIRDFFLEEGFNVDFLEEQKLSQIKEIEDKNRNLLLQVNNLERKLEEEVAISQKLLSERKIKTYENIEALKKVKILSITSLILVLLFTTATIVILITNNRLESKDYEISSLIDSNKDIQKRVKYKNSKIDSLMKVVLIKDNKEDNNFGFKNNFQGDVEKVENNQNIKNLENLE